MIAGRPAPADTVAVVVGIEDYGHPDWNVSGPALDACRIAAWLQDRGVRRSQITLLVSPVAKNRATVANLRSDGLYRPATQEAVLLALKEGLVHATGTTLVVYWCGHGVEDNNGQRLFFADSMTTREDLGVNRLLGWLADESIQLPDQLVVLDACRQLADGLRVPSVPVGFRPARRSAHRRQSLLQAVGIHELAGLAADGSGAVFTGALLTALRTMPADPWPPRVQDLAERLDLSPDGATPVTVTWQDPRHNRSSTTYGRSGPANTPAMSKDSGRPAAARVHQALRAVRRINEPKNLDDLLWQLTKKYDYDFPTIEAVTLARIVDELDGLEGGWRVLRTVCIERTDYFVPSSLAVKNLITILDELADDRGGDDADAAN